MTSSNMAARHVLGLDLGTTNLRIHLAHYDRSGDPVGEPIPVLLPGSERDGSLPVVLALDEHDRVRSFGRPALLSVPRPQEGQRFVFDFKTCIGQATEDLQALGRPEKGKYCPNTGCLRPGWAWPASLRFCGFCGNLMEHVPDAAMPWRPPCRYRPEQALDYTGMLLAQIAAPLSAQLGESPRADAGWRVMAGVPAHWQQGTCDRYLQAVRQAFPLAELELVREPVAALSAYAAQGLVEGDRDGYTLVVDLGGGTTDLMLAQAAWTQDGGRRHLRLKEARFYGERFGGNDFDVALAHHAAGELGIPLDQDLLMLWKLQAREWKESFSAEMQQYAEGEATILFPMPKGGGLFEYAPVSIGRRVFERATGDLLERFRGVLERGLRRCDVSPGAVRQVLLIGGGASWYFVRESVRGLLPGVKLLAAAEPEKAVSRGLAWAPAVLAPQPQPAAPQHEAVALAAPGVTQPAPDEAESKAAAPPDPPGEEPSVVAEAIVQAPAQQNSGSATAEPPAPHPAPRPERREEESAPTHREHAGVGSAVAGNAPAPAPLPLRDRPIPRPPASPAGGKRPSWPEAPEPHSRPRNVLPLVAMVAFMLAALAANVLFFLPRGVEQEAAETRISETPPPPPVVGEEPPPVPSTPSTPAAVKEQPDVKMVPVKMEVCTASGLPFAKYCDTVETRSFPASEKPSGRCTREEHQKPHCPKCGEEPERRGYRFCLYHSPPVPLVEARY